MLTKLERTHARHKIADDETARPDCLEKLDTLSPKMDTLIDQSWLTPWSGGRQIYEFDLKKYKKFKSNKFREWSDS